MCRTLFFELLQVALGTRRFLSKDLSAKEWINLYEESEKQSIEGIMLSGLEQLPEEQRPPQELLLQWIGITQMTEQNTQRLAKASLDAVDYFHKNGFACTLLKGGAVGRYYAKPDRRSSGDVDIWVEGSRERIYEFARNYDKNGNLYGVNYQHIHFHLFDDVHLEVHIWPAYLNNPIHNKRFHKFCEKYRPSNIEAMPSLAFDRVFILLHCYRHMCGHGVGLRQIMDYYYVLKQGFTEEEQSESVKWIKKLGMYRYASGVMWVLKEIFGLTPEYELLPPNEKEGKFILEEVLQTGNMGHGDNRNWGTLNTPLSRFFFNLRRDIHLFKHYPAEIGWQPFFSLWLYSWRILKGLNKEKDDD